MNTVTISLDTVWPDIASCRFNHFCTLIYNVLYTLYNYFKVILKC